MNTDDKYSKYIRLFGTIFFTFIAFIVALILIMLGLRLLFGLLNQIPWFVYAYMLLIILTPAALFITVFIIYILRTKTHPSAVVKYISYVFFIAGLAAWGIFLVMDLTTFFKYHYNDIAHYNMYNLLFLSCNVGLIFLTGIIQAFSMPKEIHWMERRKNNLP